MPTGKDGLGLVLSPGQARALDGGPVLSLPVPAQPTKCLWLQACGGAVRGVSSPRKVTGRPSRVGAAGGIPSFITKQPNLTKGLGLALPPLPPTPS